MNYARLTIIPFALILAVVAYQVVFNNKDEISIYFIPLGLIITLILIFGEQINNFFYKKYPQRVDENIRALLQNYSPFYSSLSEEEKEKFENRLWLSIQHMEFIGMKLDGDVPYDIQAISMIPSIELSFGLENFIFDNYNRMVLYQHPFPSIQYNDWHSCEHHIEDGVILFSLEQLMASFSTQDRYYDIALHEFASIYLNDNPIDEWLNFALTWDDLDKIASYDQDKIEAWLGLKQPSNHAAIIHHYFRFNNNFEQSFPDAYKEISKQFGIDLSNRR